MMKQAPPKFFLKTPVTWFIIACILLLKFELAEPFQKIVLVPKKNVAIRTSSSMRTRLSLATSSTKDKTNAAILTFRGDQSFTSKSIPTASTAKLYEFFQVDENRNCLVSSGGKQEVRAVETTPELLERWKSEAARMGAAEPTDGDVMLKVGTGGINFPGLKLVSVALVGSKLLETSSSNDYPEYQFTLVTDERFAEGAPPIVWLYNQLTGSGNEKKSSSSSATAHSLARVTIGQTGDDLNFSISSSLEIGVKFPSLLLRLLPVSKEKAEKQGSVAILKILSKDTEASLVSLRDRYKKWIDQ